MTTTRVPTSGDPEVLPRGTVTRPSRERQTFTNSGARKPGGPGPLTEERFYEHPDLEKFPQWVRTRGNEWTTQPFRQIVFTWMIGFFEERDWPKRWDIKEVAAAERSVNRLAEDKVHLVIGITPKAGDRVEVGVAFPPTAREGNPDAVCAVLGNAATTLDALIAQQQ